jgi:hypothetical protein
MPAKRGSGQEYPEPSGIVIKSEGTWCFGNLVPETFGSIGNKIPDTPYQLGRGLRIMP